LYRYAREIELREKTGPTTSANAPERAIDRLTNKRDQAATIPVRSNMERKRKIISSPLNPNRWFLALHDAVLQMNAVETISSRGGDAGESVDKSHAWRFTGHIARAFVTPTGNLVGRTPREVDFRNKYNSVIIRIFRGGNALPVSRIGRVVRILTHCFRALIRTLTHVTQRSFALTMSLCWISTTASIVMERT